MVDRANGPNESDSLFPEPGGSSDDGLLISESATLYAAIQRVNRCETGFTLFATDSDGRVTGVLSRGDILRCLEQVQREQFGGLEHHRVSEAMTPHLTDTPGRPAMLFVDATSENSWYEQLSQIRSKNRSRWTRIKLLPVLDGDQRLLNVLDLESPRTRARIETLVMAEAFPLERGSDETITDASLARRRAQFDSIHYSTHWQKARGLCELLLARSGGTAPMLRDVFNRARADEIVHGLWRYDEWLQGHLSAAGMTKAEQDKLRSQIKDAIQGLERRYQEATVSSNYFPAHATQDVYESPELIIVLGCRADKRLRERVDAAIDVVRHLAKGCKAPTVVLSGGGDGHEESEAQRMLQHAMGILGKEAVHKGEKAGWWTFKVGKRTVDVVLEEDSLDTLGNAVFSWLTLKMEGDRFGLTAASSRRVARIVLVTDSLHAPRSHDVFRRVFAFRSNDHSEISPSIAVRMVSTDLSLATTSSALEHLRSEARANSQSFRLVNPLTNGFDIIGNGHVRSILGQMLRLHDMYKNRWDLVRKYYRCWEDEESQ